MNDIQITNEHLQDEINLLRSENKKLRDQQSITDEANNTNRYLLRFLSDYIYTVKIYEGRAVETIHGSGCYPITGYTADDYINDPELWYNMVHQEDRQAVTEQSQKALHGQEVAEIQHRIIHREGEVKWVKNTIVLIRNSEDQLTHYYGLINDITELKKAEQLNDIKNEQLIMADKMATIGILASGIAHEINNPNNFVLLNTQLFKKFWEDASTILDEYYASNGDFALGGISYEAANSKIDQLLSGLENGSKRIQKIVNRLKDFTAYAPREDIKPVDINEIVQNALLISDNFIKKSTKKFSEKLENNIPAFKGHQNQLEQVIINLLSNACQSLSNSNKKVELKTRFDAKNNQILITVSDEGRGIEEKDMKYIFDPFFTTKRNDGGTGLGLSISYNIIKNHHGELLYNSQPGHGTIATIVLPANK